MPATHKNLSSGHLLCTFEIIEYCSKSQIVKPGEITMKSIFEQNGYYIPIGLLVYISS